MAAGVEIRGKVGNTRVIEKMLDKKMKDGCEWTEVLDGDKGGSAQLYRTNCS